MGNKLCVCKINVICLQRNLAHVLSMRNKIVNMSYISVEEISVSQRKLLLQKFGIALNHLDIIIHGKVSSIDFGIGRKRGNLIRR